jgi:diguanylate cyclase (GGDEF)-like protein
LSIAVDAKPLFRRGVPRLHLWGEKEATDGTFQTLRIEADRELADLLQDVGTEPCGAFRKQSLTELLTRAVRCAMKQYLLQAELGNLALTDPLTGLYNRRGFEVLTDRQLKLGRRAGREMLLIFIDVDGLKQINDSLGHCEGDRVLQHGAQTLKKTFRDSDIISRLGGDEFAVLAIEAPGYTEARIRERLEKYLKMGNAKESRYVLSLSLGVARFDRGASASISDLMAQADRAMYDEKRRRSRPSITLEAGYQTQ